MGLAVHMLLHEDEQQAIAEAQPGAQAYTYNLGAPRRIEAERRGLTQFVDAPGTGTMKRGPQPDRHIAPEERRDLDASLAKLSEEERNQRNVRRKTPGGIPGFVVGNARRPVTPFFDEYMATGANYMVLSFQWGNLSHEQAMRSIKLFREHLICSLSSPDKPWSNAQFSILPCHCDGVLDAGRNLQSLRRAVRLADRPDLELSRMRLGEI